MAESPQDWRYRTPCPKCGSRARPHACDVPMPAKRDRERCAQIVDARIRDAEEDCRDHKNDADIVRIELAAYLRGLRDAALALRNGR